MAKGTLDLPWESVGLDLDGTLVDTGQSLALAVNEVRQSMGLPSMGDLEVGRHVGLGLEELLDGAIPEAGSLDREERIAAFREAYDKHLLEGVEPMPGAEDLLTALDEDGCHLFVLSNKPHEWSNAIIDHLGWARFFGGVYGGDSYPWRKPDERTLIEASPSSMRCTLFIGDSGVDAETARKAGADFALVLTGRVAHYGDEDDAMQTALLTEKNCAALLARLDNLPRSIQMRGCRKREA